MLKQLAFGMVIGASAVGALADNFTDVQANPASSAYAQDGRGAIARSAFGLCWRTGYWTPSDSVIGCDGDLAPPVAKPIAPALVAQSAVPAAPVAPKRCDFTTTLGSDQAFAFDKAQLTDAAKQRIDSEVLAKLANCSRIEFLIVTGHTDRLGTQQYNQKLSDLRANAVAGYLKAKGVAARIETLGVGKTQSIKSCDDKLKHKILVECLAPNRRVVIEARGLAK